MIDISFLDNDDEFPPVPDEDLEAAVESLEDEE